MTLLDTSKTSFDEEQTQVRACWMYFVDGLTQSEIAERLQTTRLRVNRLLADARTGGLVGISINSPLASCISLEQRLVQACGLREAVIVPTPAEDALVASSIGRAAAGHLSRLVARRQRGVVSVGWGATLRETIRHLRAVDRPDLDVTSMMGGLTSGLDLNTFEIASELARRWNARCHYLAAPIYAGSARSRQLILEQDVFTEAFDRVRSSDFAILSLGDLTTRSLLIRHGLPREVSSDELREAGAVGDALGQFIDRRGSVIDHPVNSRVIALPLASLAGIPHVVLASGGAHKVAVIAAALRARLADVLISDERSASAALALIEADP